MTRITMTARLRAPGWLAGFGLIFCLAALGSGMAPANANSTPDQYRITIVQGASRAEAQSLMSDRVASRRSTRSSRSGSQQSTLWVTSGVPARVESGRSLYAIDSIYVAYAGLRVGSGIGVERSEKPLHKGLSVTATSRGNRVEVAVEPFVTREGRDAPENRERQSLSTQLTVSPGTWVVVGGGGDVGLDRRKSYSTRARLEDSLVLMRIDRLDAAGRSIAR